MTADLATKVTIVDADLSRAEHQHALVTMLDAFMRDPMEGGQPCQSKASAIWYRVCAHIRRATY